MSGKKAFALCMIAIVAMLVGVTGAHASDECEGLYYVGDLFDKFGATYLCAQAGCPCTCQPDPSCIGGAGVWFQVWDLWGIRRTNGPQTTLLTNSVGRVCDPQNFGSGVFEVQAFGADDGDLAGVTSPPVAVTVYNCAPGIGIAAGGAVLLDTCKRRICGPQVVTTDNVVPRQECGCVDMTCRRATFGLYYDVCKPQFDPRRLRSTLGLGFDFCFNIPLPDSRNEQLLYLDPCRPDSEGGPVRIKVVNYRTATLPVSGHVNIIPAWFYVKFDGLRLTGYCEFTEGDNPPVTKYFEATLKHNFWILSKSPYFKLKDAAFEIRVWEYPNRTLYQAGGKIQDGGTKIF